MAAKRIERQFKQCNDTQEKSYSVTLVDSNWHHWILSIAGPKQTPYYGGVFKVDAILPPKYPFQPPKCRFLTKILHPSINKDGEICPYHVDCIFYGDWFPTKSMKMIIEALQKLLNNCDEVGCGYPVSGLIKTGKFFNAATKWTYQYAMPTKQIQVQTQQITKKEKGIGANENKCTICLEEIKAIEQQIDLGFNYRFHSKCLQNQHKQSL